MKDKRPIKKLLEKLNAENYTRLAFRETVVVSDVERVLCRIEDCLFGNHDIQNNVWEKFKHEK